MDLEEIYYSRLFNDGYNTSYPLSPKNWAPYCVTGELPFSGVTDLCFYLHVPFCQQLCSFCEYTRMICPVDDIQIHYVQSVLNDMTVFVRDNPEIVIHGFDIGGGTPTSLSFTPFRMLLEGYSRIMSQLGYSLDFEPSIEGTFQSINQEKALMIAENGFHRVSLGIQSSCEGVLRQNGRRNSTVSEMKTIINILHECGIRKVNLDLIYGLRGQTMESLQIDLDLIKELAPEQVTLYELRTNMIKEESHSNHEERYSMYECLFASLTDMEYHSVFGQNTFSKDASDMGVSSYLRHRMTEGMPYKGFGISSQSMNEKGISYNIGKNAKSITNLLSSGSFPSQQTYLLPPEEIAAKYVAISAYSGAFSWSRFKALLGDCFCSRHTEALDFAVRQGLLQQNGDCIRITKLGFVHYGAVFSLFYPYK